MVHFFSTYIFSTDHKMIGKQFLFSSLIWLVVGGLLALALRWQLAWPWTDMPLLGQMLFASEGGQISPEFYNMLFTMHATIMIFFVIIPLLTGAFGNFLIPLMIGADDMAFPKLNMLSYWLMWPAFACIVLAFLMPGFGAGAGWTSYAPLSTLVESAPNSFGSSDTLDHQFAVCRRFIDAWLHQLHHNRAADAGSGVEFSANANDRLDFVYHCDSAVVRAAGSYTGAFNATFRSIIANRIFYP